MTTSISTPRLLLRPWCDQDLDAFAALNSDPRVMKDTPALLSRPESDALAQRFRTQLAADGFGAWAVEEKAGSAFIGFIGLARPSFSAHFTPCVEIGWRLAATHWGQGLATEGAAAALQFGFTELALDEIVAFTSTGNLASRRVMEKLHMRYDPREDFDHPKLPHPHRLRRHVLYRLPRSTWQPDSEAL